MAQDADCDHSFLFCPPLSLGNPQIDIDAFPDSVRTGSPGEVSQFFQKPLTQINAAYTSPNIRRKELAKKQQPYTKTLKVTRRNKTRFIREFIFERMCFL